MCSNLIFLIIPLLFFSVIEANYKPDWSSIDARPLPNWFDDSKLGIFCHWGVYSVPAYGSEWFWWYWQGERRPDYQKFVERHFPNGTKYADFAKLFTAEDFDAQNIAEIIKASGARYFVHTSKHCEGFTMYPSVTSWNWNAFDIGPRRDLVQELGTAIRGQGLRYGLYLCQYEWFNPIYLRDKKAGTRDYPQTVSYPQLMEIVNQYHPDVVWSDGDWEQSDVYWRSKEFLAWLYNDSPVKDIVAVNDRWGAGTWGKHGGYMTYQDHYDPGFLQPRKWENCLTLDKLSWGYRRDLKSSDVLSLVQLITQLARTISCGGNMLLNIGPDHTGRIVPIFEERLRQFGQWVGTNQEAIYGSKPWIKQTDGPFIWYTSKLGNSSGLDPHRLYNPQQMYNTVIYAFILNIPPQGRINFPSIRITDKTRVTILGTASIKVPFKKASATLWVDLSSINWQDLPSVVSIVLKVEYAASSNDKPTIREMLTVTERDNRIGINRSAASVSRRRIPSSSVLSSSSSSAENERNDDDRVSRLAKIRMQKDTDDTESDMLNLVAAADKRED